jgi:hypothetical protein
MSLGTELAALFARDLARLAQEIDAFPDDGAPWETAPGVHNSAGNLVLHLEGNLRHYIGHHVAGVAYTRSRKQEFSQTGMTREELRGRVEDLSRTIPGILAGLSDADLSRTFPEIVFSGPLSTSQFLIHLHGHFNYHLGQIDYLRRILTQDGAVAFLQL